jgi:phospho-N-acetylmuramoyl-pentapeptide-transferase
MHEEISYFNVFRYITFRSAYAGVTALLLSFTLGPPLVRWLRSFKIRQTIRREGAIWKTGS